jgi:hypothetical protein
MQISEYSPYQNFVFALKSKDVKRQYPAMLSRFFDCINLEGKSLEEKCKIFYDFANKLENRRMLESQIMYYISFQEERVKIKKEITAGTLRNYLIKQYKDKYQWLETAESKQNEEGTIIKFFNIDQPSEYLEVRLRENQILIYLKYGTKKIRKLKKITPNIFQFQYEKSFSEEESIGRSFSTRYSPGYFEFINSILPALNMFDYKTAMLFLKDKKFIKSLDKTKEKFDDIYKSIKNPSKYSLESHAENVVSKLLRSFYFKELNLLDNK